MIRETSSSQGIVSLNAGSATGSALPTLTPLEIEEHLLVMAEDPDLRETLLQNPQEMWQHQFGQTSVASWKLRVFEDTETVLHLIAPVVDQELRGELRSQPEIVWQHELGSENLWGYQIHVVEQRLDEFCLVLPWVEPTEAAEVGLLGGWSLQRHATAEGQASGRPNRRAAKAGRISRMARNRGVAEVRRLSGVRRLLQPFYLVRAWLFKWRRL
jgi:hypothetical protein